MRPVDVLAHRDILNRDLNHNESFQSAFRYTHAEREKAKFHNIVSADQLMAVARSSIRAGETFLVTKDMNELAEAASLNMPPEPLVPEDLPSTHGLLWIEDGIQTKDIRGTQNSTSVFLWSTTSSGVVVMTWSYKYDMKDEVNDAMHKDLAKYAHAPNLMWTGYAGALKFGGLPPVQYTAKNPIPTTAQIQWTDDNRLFVEGVEVETTTAGRNHELSWLIAAWRLMQQTITSTTREQVPAKKVRRFDLKDTMVSVITLRHRAPFREDGETQVEWRHRWVVRGHWRHQPYKGEDGGVIYRWIYINPFIKGPEGAPLKRSEKVNVWKQ
jgi:hypothetical protein